MYRATVHTIRRGFFGPRYTLEYDEISTTPEPLLAEISKYRDDWHVVHFQDFTQSHGDYDDRPDYGPTAWDAATGEPVADDRDRPGYHMSIADYYSAESARGDDDDLPF